MLNKKCLYGITCALLSTNLSIAETAVTSPNNGRFEQLKLSIFEQPYTELPRYKVTRRLFKKTNNNQSTNLYDDAKRTLIESSDLLPPNRGQKLLQANGICFSGHWNIDNESDFSGLFRQGTKVPVISRISVSFSGTQQNERRALGIALKLLPRDLGDQASLNVFALHSVGGVKTKHVLDLAMDNEPALGRIPLFGDILTALKLKNELLKADKDVGSKEPSVNYRTVFPLAEYREQNAVSAPRWIRFTPKTVHRADEIDFRDELRVEKYPNNEIVYTIEAGVTNNQSDKKGNAKWQPLGQLVLNESTTSAACDTRLHFAHPKN